MPLKLTNNDAQEVAHKVGVLADTPDLQEDYALTQEQADELRDSVPHEGGEWIVPAWGVEAARGEMADHCEVLADIAADARSGGFAMRVVLIRFGSNSKRLPFSRCRRTPSADTTGYTGNGCCIEVYGCQRCSLSKSRSIIGTLKK